MINQYFHRIALGVAALAICGAAAAKVAPCSEAIGKKKAKELVHWCLQVSPATHPPCHISNSCELIANEIKRGCGLLDKDPNRPYFCLLTGKN